MIKAVLKSQWAKSAWIPTSKRSGLHSRTLFLDIRHRYEYYRYKYYCVIIWCHYRSRFITHFLILFYCKLFLIYYRRHLLQVAIWFTWQNKIPLIINTNWTRTIRTIETISFSGPPQLSKASEALRWMRNDELIIVYFYQCKLVLISIYLLLISF